MKIWKGEVKISTEDFFCSYCNKEKSGEYRILSGLDDMKSCKECSKNLEDYIDRYMKK